MEVLGQSLPAQPQRILMIVYDQDTWTYLGSHEIETTQDECPIPVITTWSMTGDGVNFDGTNQDGITGYQIEYSTSTFTPGDGTATVYEFDAFPHTMTGLQPSTTYYFTIRSICGDNYSEWEQNPDNNGDGPDAYTTTTCPSSYSLPYLNDFNDPVAWTSCQTFNDNDGDGNFWFYQAFDADTADLSANSASYINGVGPLTPDNWVIMGPIDLTITTLILCWSGKLGDSMLIGVMKIIRFMWGHQITMVTYLVVRLVTPKQFQVMHVGRGPTGH